MDYPEALLAAFDEQARMGSPSPPAGVWYEHDGPLLRATLSDWRGQGIYRALVARRAQLAAARGFRYLQVDASSNSAPILRRLGFQPIATTTPYVWTPPA